MEEGWCKRRKNTRYQDTTMQKPITSKETLDVLNLPSKNQTPAQTEILTLGLNFVPQKNFNLFFTL